MKNEFECQKACKSDRNCHFFLYSIDLKLCTLFDRPQNQTCQNVIGASPPGKFNQTITKCIVNFDTSNRLTGLVLFLSSFCIKQLFRFVYGFISEKSTNIITRCNEKKTKTQFYLQFDHCLVSVVLYNPYYHNCEFAEFI